MDDFGIEGDGKLSMKYRLFDAQYSVNPQEHKAIEQEIQHILYDVAVAKKIFPTKVMSVRGANQYLWSKEVMEGKVIISKDFLAEKFNKANEIEETIELFGFSQDILVADTDESATESANYYTESLLRRNVRAGIAKVQDAFEEYLWLGSAGTKYTPAPHGAVEGFVNPTGLNAFDAADCTAAGGIYETVNLGIAELVADKYKPPFHVVMTKLMLAKAYSLFNATTNKSDAQMIYEMADENGNKIIKSVNATSNILAAAETTGNQVCIVIADKDNNGDPVGAIVESVPFQVLSNKRIAAIQVKPIVKGAPVIYRPEGIAVETAISLV